MENLKSRLETGAEAMCFKPPLIYERNIRIEKPLIRGESCSGLRQNLFSYTTLVEQIFKNSYRLLPNLL